MIVGDHNIQKFYLLLMADDDIFLLSQRGGGAAMFRSNFAVQTARRPVSMTCKQHNKL